MVSMMRSIATPGECPTNAPEGEMLHDHRKHRTGRAATHAVRPVHSFAQWLLDSGHPDVAGVVPVNAGLSVAVQTFLGHAVLGMAGDAIGHGHDQPCGGRRRRERFLTRVALGAFQLGYSNVSPV